MGAFSRVAPHAATRERVRRAFSHLVLSDRVLDQLGPAINAGQSLFIYGPAGQRQDADRAGDPRPARRDIAIPYAIEVEGQIVRVFDPVKHEPIAGRCAERRRFDLGSARRRPLGPRAGGRWSWSAASSRSTRSARPAARRLLPGAAADARQRRRAGHRRLRPPALPPTRAAEPLDRAAREPRRLPDAQTGQKFELPFAALVVFATNLRPQRPRRRGVPPPHPLQGLRSRARRARSSPRSSSAAARRAASTSIRRSSTHLLRRVLPAARMPLRGCHPRDLIEHALSLADYRGEPRAHAGAARRACDVYFVDDSPVAPLTRLSMSAGDALSLACRGGRSSVPLLAAAHGARRSGRAVGPHHLAARAAPASRPVRIVAQVTGAETPPCRRSGSSSTQAWSARTTTARLRRRVDGRQPVRAPRDRRRGRDATGAARGHRRRSRRSRSSRRRGLERPARGDGAGRDRAGTSIRPRARSSR